MYIIEAAAEYLISILVTGSFLAVITKELGLSDSLTGILSSVISLGCLFQLLSMAFHPRRNKRFVIVLSIVNQLLFSSLYIIPLMPLSQIVKTALFISAVFIAYLIYYIAHPKKIAWMMSTVDENKRGSFTSLKEAVSLIAGMTFSYAMGAMVDRFSARGETASSFVICIGIILAFTAAHTLSMAFTADRPVTDAAKTDLRTGVRRTLTDRRLRGILLLFALYNIASFASRPFYGVYQLNDLHFSLTFISVLSIGSSLFRIAASVLWGRYADKTSFLKMMGGCLIFVILSDVCVMLAFPSNGKIMFTLFYILNGIAQGGINSALTNIIFDCVEYERRADSLAVCQAVSGVIGFIATLAVSPLVSLIQTNGLSVLGIGIHAQQVTAAISLVLMSCCALYTRLLARRAPVSE
jgi:MFS family permease